MIFSKNAILSAIDAGALKIEPFDESMVDKAHIDLHLELPDEQQNVIIPSHGFFLAKTKEKITTDITICASMEGRASLAKIGISIEQSSTFIEPESDSQMVLEIYNASDADVTLTIGQPISKMFIMRVIDTY